MSNDDADPCPSVGKSRSCQTACASTCYDSALFEFVDRCCDCNGACGLTGARSVLAFIILLLTLALLARQRWLYFPLGRTMGPAACAVLMVLVESDTLSAESLLDLPGVIDLNTVVTLFGLTIVTGMLTEVGILTLGAKLLRHRCTSAFDLLLRVVVITTVCSAIFTNDAAVILLTQPILETCDAIGLRHAAQHELFLVALATTANIGSALTLIGNPQNVLIGMSSGISFGNFIIWMFPAVSIGLLLNTLFLIIYYYQVLESSGIFTSADVSGAKNSLVGIGQSSEKNSGILDAPANLGDNLIRTPLMDRQVSGENKVNEDLRVLDEDRRNSPGYLQLEEGEMKAEEESNGEGLDHDHLNGRALQRWSFATNNMVPSGRTASRGSVVLVHGPRGDRQASLVVAGPFKGTVVSQKAERRLVVAIVALLIVGFIFSTSIAWTVMAAVVLLALVSTSFREGFEPTEVLQHVDLPLLVMIGSLFIVIAGARLTGATELVFRGGSFVFGSSCDFDSDSLYDVLGSSSLVLVLSNLCSNVPTVMLLIGKIKDNDLGAVHARISWLVLAWASTAAGNLTLTGSIANLIVAERASQYYKNNAEASNGAKPQRVSGRDSENTDKGEERGLSFVAHFRFSSWSTLIILFFGSGLIFLSQSPQGESI